MRERLETERLLLRKPERSDIPALLPLLGNWDIVKNLGQVPHPYSEADARAFFDSMIGKGAEQFDISTAVTLKPDGLYIGGCGLHLRESGQFELGYWISKSFWGNGYATEAAGVVMQAAFAGGAIAQLTAGYFHDNPASGRVLTKLGFAPDGEEMRECRARGHPVLCHNVVFTRAMFKARQAA